VPQYPGKFIVLDGVDGAGKSTQAYLLSKYLAEKKLRVRPVREPGGTELGERIREILLDPGEDKITDRCELLLYMASRAQLVGELIHPSLEAGYIVVSERFLFSSVAYQGYAGGLPVEDIWAIGAFAVSGVEPDLTIILDVDPELAMRRDKGPSVLPGGEEYDRIEKKGTEFQKKVREGFLHLARQRPGKMAVIDAVRPAKVVHEDIKKLVAGVIG
jgi:dTMP kinase